MYMLIIKHLHSPHPKRSLAARYVTYFKGAIYKLSKFKSTSEFNTTSTMSKEYAQFDQSVRFPLTEL